MNQTQTSPSPLEQILAELDEDHLATLYDEPIQKCCLEFLQTHEEPTDYKTFNQNLTEFLQQITQEALPLKINLTPEQAFSKAKRLLDHHYPGGGYERAYLDTTLPNGPGHTTILKNLTQTLITQQHTHHITWTIMKYATTWKNRLALIHEILREQPNLLPPELTQTPTWTLTEQIPELLGAIVTTDSTIRDLIR